MARREDNETPKKKSKKPVETAGWSIPGFPVKLRLRFVGRCRMKGENVAVILSRIIRKWLVKQESLDQDDD